MKKFALYIACCAVSISAFAQNKNVRKAEDALKDKKYDEALTLIQPAQQDDKTKDDAKTWFLSGEIHEGIATQNKDPQEAMKAFSDYQKVLSIDPKYPEALLKLGNSLSNLYVVVGNAGYGNLNDKKYDSAYTKFQDAYNISDFLNSKGLGKIPTDTAMVFYTGYAADQSGSLDSAMPYYIKADTLGYHKEPYLYFAMAKYYQQNKDNDKWISTLQKGKEIFPQDNRFNDQIAFYYQQTGNMDELLKSYEQKLDKNPNDFDTWLNYGIQLDNLANPKSATGSDSTKPANYDEYMKKAETAYKKAISLKGDDAIANYQLGALYFNQAVAINKQINDLPSAQANSDKAKQLYSKVDSLVSLSLPLFEKAETSFGQMTDMEASDKNIYRNCLYALQKIYAMKNEMDKVKAVKTKLDAMNTAQ